MKYLTLFQTIVILQIGVAAIAQEQIVLCESQNTKLLESGKQIVVDYTRLIETLTQSTEYEVQEKIKGKIFLLTEGDKIQIEDDITAYSHEGRRFELDNYLANIRNHVTPDTDVRYNVSDPTQVYYQPDQNFYYTLVEAEKIVQKPEGPATYVENFFVKITQIEKNLPILRISDVAIKRPKQLQVGNPVRTRPCFVEVKPFDFLIPSEESISIFRRGNTNAYSIEWEGGILEDSLLIEMIRFDKRGEIASKDTLLNNYQNSGYYTQWYIDKKQYGNFRLRMTKLNSEEPSVFSDYFKIKRKMPLGYKIGVPALVGGGIAIYLITKPEVEKVLPEVPSFNE
jgi:hypothetical protein